MRTLTLNQADKYRTNEREFIFIGCTPHDEYCTQAGANAEDSIIECKALANQLRRIYGREPEGCEFFILHNFHEFGEYYEAAIFFNCSDPDETDETDETDITFDYASKCELIPDKWDTEALQELRLAGHSKYQPAKVIQMKRIA